MIAAVISDLEKTFHRVSDENKAIEMHSYMRCQFPFYGIQAPLRRTIQKKWFKEIASFGNMYKWEIVHELWKKPQREFQLVAIDWMRTWKKDSWQKSDRNELIFILTQKSWWDTVDLIASSVVANFLVNCPEEKDDFLNICSESSNLWLNRTCILFQLKYKDDTDIPLLQGFIHKFKSNSDFFIQKAIGWSLRELAKRDPEKVKAIIKEEELQGLAKREALKHVIH